MASIKEIAEAVGVSNALVSRVLNYDESVSVSDQTRKKIFQTAEKMGYKKKVIYPKIENVALLYFVEEDDELEQNFYDDLKNELLHQAKKRNVQIEIFQGTNIIDSLPQGLEAFVAIGWLSRKEIKKLYKKCHNGVFIGTSPDEKLFDSVRPNYDSFVTQIVDYFVEHEKKSIGFVGVSDRNIDTLEPCMDIREWSFRQSAIYYNCLNESNIFIAKKNTVANGYEIGKKITDLPTIPEALCVASDTLAVGILQALNEAGKQIPDDVSVFSINDMNIAKYVSPPLTTIHIDIPILCENALDLLCGRVLKKSKITKTIFVNGISVYRKSC